ncbi:MAG: hypothetical protein U9Q21_02740, partial [Candidatus Auribacterota bacterium]|nr:hypothetical protein [Candidatus Auribacterota bacterium]
NSCRSPMAEGYFNYLARQKNLNAVAKSAGISTFGWFSAAPEAIQVMRENGIDVSSHKARKLAQEMIDRSDIVAVMTSNHKKQINSKFKISPGKLKLLKEYSSHSDLKDMEISDPIGKPLKEYKKCFENMKLSIEHMVEVLCE